MESVHHSVWKAAGVYDAIKGLVYNVHTDKHLIFGLAERWCCDTSTFVFPWGEATVTLEDIMILGGFSVLGGPVWFPLQSPELVEIEQNLEKARIFAFPVEQYDKISTHVFRVASNLARGKRLALAPAVLSSIYRDLSLLREAMTISTSSKNKDDRNRFQILGFCLSSPLLFIQAWAWERLVVLRPKQAGNYNMVGGARIGRWHDVKRSGVINVRAAIDSSAETFQWRPYALSVEGSSVPKFYKETEEWEIVENFGPRIRVLYSMLAGVGSCWF
ncbi:protein MAINTENANCE OF MERISTEMS-like [Capsicum annuum]|uniref:protein MAINTENANCE OF MERISTEMS-like n=1 Tax=Capsicum annuum TaxID=4072 RepID=UPI001FB05DC4|nr:protein MAINTENANCE OF MERISTEMS-like [Capsicum annuum]